MPRVIVSRFVLAAVIAASTIGCPYCDVFRNRQGGPPPPPCGVIDRDENVESQPLVIILSFIQLIVSDAALTCTPGDTPECLEENDELCRFGVDVAVGEVQRVRVTVRNTSVTTLQLFEARVDECPDVYV